MGDEVGRAGFHARHIKAVGERRALLHEMMRELDPESIAYWAARNPSIVVEDEPLNVALVNDGNGGMKPCTDREEVIAYGEARLAKVGRKIKEDRIDLKDGKKKGGTITTTAIVCHLPKSMCVEVPEFYPRFHKDGSPMIDPATGEQMRRSRWVARDRDEALQYFADVRAYLCAKVVPGGQAALLGEDIQFSETTPHDQFLFDAFADDPKKPGMLKAAASEAYYSSRNVKDEHGRQMSGRAKFRSYHAGLKAYLIEKGYDISPDFDELLHDTGATKDTYGAIQDAQAEVVAREAVVADTEAKVNSKVAEVNEYVTDTLPKLKVKAKAEGYAEGRQEGYDAGLAEGQAEADREAAQGRQETARAIARAEAREKAAQDEREALKAERARLAATTPEMDWWLDKPRRDGKTFRPIFEREVAERRRSLRRIEALAEAAEPQVTADDVARTLFGLG